MEDYYKNAVIPPPEDDLFYEGNTRNTRIVVDSKDRNLTLFPEPNNYEIVFDDDINDVVSAKLINIQMPMSTYLINKYFNQIKIIIGTTVYNAVLTIGDYTAANLAIEIADKLNGMSSPNTFDCIYNTLTDNFTILSNNTFKIDFTTVNPLCFLLGFKKQIYQAITTVPTNLTYPYMIKSEYRKNFDFNNYIVMSIDNFDLNRNQTNPLNKSFAIIGSDYNTLNISDEPDIVKYFAPPINKIDKLRIKFYDRYNNPYDFQNADHRFELLFKNNKQRRKYGAMLKNLLKQ